MNYVFELVQGKYEVFLLILVRITGIFLISPVFSRNNTPTIIKIGFSFVVSIILLNVIDSNIINIDIFDYSILIVKELAIGLLIGFISYLFFTALYLSGQIIDMQIGFGMVNVMDPQHNVQIPIMGNYYYVFAILLFLLIDGHHLLIKGIIQSYDFIPIGEFIFTQDLLNQMIYIMGQVFTIGFKISSPILATIFLADVLLGILARTMPQMNVFVVGMPLKIIVGIITLVVTFPLLFIALQHIFDNMYEEIFNFLKVIQKG